MGVLGRHRAFLLIAFISCFLLDSLHQKNKSNIGEKVNRRKQRDFEDKTGTNQLDKKITLEGNRTWLLPWKFNKSLETSVTHTEKDMLGKDFKIEIEQREGTVQNKEGYIRGNVDATEEVDVECGRLDINPRVYINPVRALLDQHQWNGAFLEEIYKGLNHQDIKGTSNVYFPHYKQSENLPPRVYKPRKAPIKNTNKICCSKLFAGNETYVKHIFQTGKSSPKLFPSAQELINQTKDCKSFVENREYTVDGISDDEENFPLAYSLLMYKDVGQMEHLLKAIYRPQNYYCVHIDQNSERVIHDAAKSLAQCFNNVMVGSASVPVHWGGSGILEAELVCLNDLWNAVQSKRKKWKYFINLTGQEFPLKTNWEIVQILKAYNGAVDVGASVSKLWTRWNCIIKFGNQTVECRRRNRRPLFNYTLAQGQTHSALTYEFVDYALHHPMAKELYKWLKPTYFPDESFFNTLFSSPQLQVPSAYTGPPNWEYRSVHPMVRYKRWYDWKGCKGLVQRYICIVALWDLPELRARPEMFVNKLEAGYHPLAYQCLEELHYAKIQQEMEALRAGRTPIFDTSLYRQLPWVRNHL